MGAKGKAFRHRTMACSILKEYSSCARGGSRYYLSGLERFMTCLGLLVLPHQQVLLIKHHLKLIGCCFAASCVLHAKEAMQSESFYMPLIHDHMALLVSRRGLLVV